MNRNLTKGPDNINPMNDFKSFSINETRHFLHTNGRLTKEKEIVARDKTKEKKTKK